MKIGVIDLSGNKVKDINLEKEVFSVSFNTDLVNQAIRVYQFNQRKALAKTLTRSEVNRTTKKVYRQKGTGNARHGSRRAPIYVGGGVSHGPHGVQNYSLTLPKKMKIAALKSVLSQKAEDKQITIIDSFKSIKTPKTKTFDQFLSKNIKSDYRRVGIIFSSEDQNAIKSSKNLPNVSCLYDHSLTTFEVFNTYHLIFTENSLKNLVNRLIK